MREKQFDYAKLKAKKLGSVDLVSYNIPVDWTEVTTIQGRSTVAVYVVLQYDDFCDADFRIAIRQILASGMDPPSKVLCAVTETYFLEITRGSISSSENARESTSSIFCFDSPATG